MTKEETLLVKEIVEQSDRVIHFLIKKNDYLCNDIAYWKELMFKLSERLERVEHSSMPTYSMKRMLRDKELNSK